MLYSKWTLSTAKVTLGIPINAALPTSAFMLVHFLEAFALSWFKTKAKFTSVNSNPIFSTPSSYPAKAWRFEAPIDNISTVTSLPAEVLSCWVDFSNAIPPSITKKLSIAILIFASTFVITPRLPSKSNVTVLVAPRLSTPVVTVKLLVLKSITELSEAALFIKIEAWLTDKSNPDIPTIPAFPIVESIALHFLVPDFSFAITKARLTSENLSPISSLVSVVWAPYPTKASTPAIPKVSISTSTEVCEPVTFIFAVDFSNPKPPWIITVFAIFKLTFPYTFSTSPIVPSISSLIVVPVPANTSIVLLPE